MSDSHYYDRSLYTTASVSNLDDSDLLAALERLGMEFCALNPAMKTGVYSRMEENARPGSRLSFKSQKSVDKELYGPDLTGRTIRDEVL